MVRYKDYIDYFFQIALASSVITERPKGNESALRGIVKELKIVDNALVAFGQFLNSYGKTNCWQLNIYCKSSDFNYKYMM